MERRGDCLVLEFRQKQEVSAPTTFSKNVASPIFAQAVIDCSGQISSSSDTESGSPTFQPLYQQQRKIQHWIEGTIDSSRYFTLRISNGGREALIGFGFRDRDQAIDLRESLQHYEGSLRREYEANTMNRNDNTSTISKYTIPKLADGERIHIWTGKSGDSNKTAKSKQKTTDSPTKSDRPILLKKPPPSSTSSSINEISSQLSNDLSSRRNVTSTIAATTQQPDGTMDKQVAQEHQAADNFDDDDDWDTEFVSAS